MALTAARDVTFKLIDHPAGELRSLPVAASTTIHKGGHVGFDADGFLVPCAGATVATTLTGLTRYAGIADESVDNSAGSDGDKRCKVLTTGTYRHAVSGLAAADVGAPVYCSADDTLTKVALGNLFAGWVDAFDESGYGYIRMPAFQTPPLFNRVSPAISVIAANKALLIHPSENQNGLIVYDAFALITEVMAGSTEDQGIITLQDTAGTTLGITFTPSNGAADALNDKVEGVGTARQAATGVLMVPVPAGLGVQAVVTQPTTGTPAGGMKVAVIAFPIG